MITRRRHVLSVVLFLQACRPALQVPRIGIIDFYGARTLSIATLRQAVGLREGDSITGSKTALLARIKRIPAV